jgi:hypothetical protein
MDGFRYIGPQKDVFEFKEKPSPDELWEAVLDYYVVEPFERIFWGGKPGGGQDGHEASEKELGRGLLQ